VGLTNQDELGQAVSLARSFEPMTAAEKETLLARVASDAGDGRHELFKSTQMFDGSIHREQHGFAPRQRG
jgi:hypothetical protein